MSTSAEVDAAMEALDGKHVWPGMNCAMVVKRGEKTLQQRRRLKDPAGEPAPPAA